MTYSATAKQVGRPREFNEEEVLRAVVDAFWHKGYEATSLADLTEKTGLNKASLYRFFGDKHSLFKTALQSYADLTVAEVKDVICHESALENIRAMLGKLAKDADHGKGCLIVNSLVELGPHDSEIAELLQGFSDQHTEVLTELIIKAQDNGEIRPELAPEKLVGLFMLTLAGVSVMAKGRMSGEAIFASLQFLVDSWT